MQLNYLKRHLSAETRDFLACILSLSLLLFLTYSLSIGLTGIAPPISAIIFTCLTLFVTDATQLRSALAKMNSLHFKQQLLMVNLFVSLGAYLLLYLIPNPVVFMLYLVACVACKVQLQPSISEKASFAAVALTLTAAFFIAPSFLSYALSACICTLPSYLLTCSLNESQATMQSLAQDDTLTGPHRPSTTLWLQNISHLHTIIQPQPFDLESLFAFIQTFEQDLQLPTNFAKDLCTYVKNNYSNTTVGNTKWSAKQALLVTWISCQAADMHDASYDKTTIIDFLRHAQKRSTLRKKLQRLYLKSTADTYSKAMIKELVNMAGADNNTQEECVYGRICILQLLFSRNIETFLESNLGIKLDHSYQSIDCIPNGHITALTVRATKQLCEAAKPFLQSTSPMNTYASQVVKPLCEKQGLTWKESEDNELQQIINSCITPRHSIQRICLWHSQRLVDKHDFSTKKPQASKALLASINDLAEEELNSALKEQTTYSSSLFSKPITHIQTAPR